MINLVDLWHVETPSRRCPKCAVPKLLTVEHWQRRRLKPGGFRNPCKACITGKGGAVPSEEDGQVKRDSNMTTWAPINKHVIVVTGPHGYDQPWSRTADKETALALTIDHIRNSVEKGALHAGSYKFCVEGTKDCRTVEIGRGL